MTVIKQVAVTSAAHASNLGRYLDDKRALLRDSQNIARENRWQAEMEATREAYGHDKPSRAGAANTVMYHQVLAFNPDECDANGGVMTPEKCMEYAREWVRDRYPNQEAVWVLHKEHCDADGTDRYAVHIGINRTDLETGRRLDEGRARKAKVDRAAAVRRMDERYGLRQMTKGERNSRVHARQPTRAEKSMEARGVRSDKQYVRDAVRASMAEVRTSPEPNKTGALARSLNAKGVKMSVSADGKDLVFERMSTGLKTRGTKLGRGYSMGGIVAGLGIRAALGICREEGQEMGQ